MKRDHSSPQTTARSLLAAENKGTEVIIRDSDGAVFIRQDVAERVVDRLCAGLREVRTFLTKEGWGTYRYMEGSGVYEDKDQALFDIAYAMRENPDAES